MKKKKVRNRFNQQRLTLFQNGFQSLLNFENFFMYFNNFQSDFWYIEGGGVEHPLQLNVYFQPRLATNRVNRFFFDPVGLMY